MQRFNFQYRLALVIWALSGVGLQATAETTPAEISFTSVAEIEQGLSAKQVETSQKFLSVELDNTFSTDNSADNNSKVAVYLPSPQIDLDNKAVVERVTSVTDLENFAPPTDRWVGHPELTSLFNLNSRSIAQSPPDSTPPETSKESPKEPTPPPPDITLDSFVTDFSYQSDNFNLVISSVEPSVIFRLANGNKLSLKTGVVNLRDQPGFQAVTIYPVRLGWEGNIERASVKAGLTLNTFDRLPSSVGFDAGVSIPVLPNLIVGASFERTPMKYAPSTLEIPGTTTYSAYGPNLLWLIDRDTSLFSFISFIDINDGNSGSISFTKLKRNFGQFSVAGNVVTTSYAKDSAPFIFTPQDFMIYNGELGWQGDLTDFLNLRAQVNLGEQRLRGEWTNALYYEFQLTAKLSPTADAFINYSFGKLSQITYFRATGANDLYSRTLIVGQLRFRF